MLSVIIGHIFLAIVLFFAINLLGQYSPSSLKYFAMTKFLEVDEAPAFNYVIRVLTPVVYLILISALLYTLHLDRFTKDIYMVCVYYVIIRIIFNFAINRSKLVNWTKHIIYAVSIILLSYFLYKKVIQNKENLLPDFSNIANELWIIIIIFLYNFFNNIQPSDNRAERRRNNYINSMYLKLYKRFHHIIDNQLDNTRLKQIVYGIMIHESFNRPKLFRVVEKINFQLTKKPHTLGIMQIKTNKLINDEQSVVLGINKIQEDYLRLKQESQLDHEEYFEDGKDDEYTRQLIMKYNPDFYYAQEVLTVANFLQNKYFFNGHRKLF